MMKTVSVIILAIGAVLILNHQPASAENDKTGWKRRVTYECARYGSIAGRSILDLKLSGTTKNDALQTAESMADPKDPLSKAIAVNVIKAIYSPSVTTYEEAGETAQDVCIKEKLKDDPTGSKTLRREAAEKRRQKEEAARAAQEAEEQAKAEKEEEARLEEEHEEYTATSEAHSAIQNEYENARMKALYIPTERKRNEALAKAEANRDEQEKQLKEKRAKYMAERIAEKRRDPKSKGKTDRELRSEIRKEDEQAKKDEQERQAELREEQIQKEEADRKAAAMKEEDARRAQREADKEFRMRQYKEQLRSMGMDPDQL